MHTTKAAFIEIEAFLESITMATVEKENEFIVRPQFYHEIKNTFLIRINI